MTRNAPSSAPTETPGQALNPWPALWALVLGFFMILVDLTIVTVATPTIIEDLDASVNDVVWVSSAYMLAYAVPVLITGRLGDRFGSKYLYLAGLTVFTLASLWCGLTTTVEGLIVARVVQGFGASMMTPQTMAIITRIFPPAQRGSAMAVWGATAGVAMVVGPLLGGVLTDGLGWEWIFFVNIPVGLVAFVMAWRLVPALPTHAHRFDWLGVALSGAAMFLLCFGIQEGHQKDWAPWIIAMIAGGAVVLVAFIAWQRFNRAEPLVPLELFRDRNFSVSTVAITCMGAIAASFGFPLMLYAQAVRGYSPTGAALLMLPMAVMSILLARLVGRLSDQQHPRWVLGFGFATSLVGFLGLIWRLEPGVAVWELAVPMALIGVGNAFIWAPTATTANRNLPMHQAGAGAGVYNATRQVGSVLGAAAIAVLMDARLAHYLPGAAAHGEAGAAQIPDPHIADLFSRAMQQSLWLPAAMYLVGLVAVMFYERPRHEGFGQAAVQE
ncbi:DHA2 family efflux MFS transporter permease subunit [Nocardioides nitrophenolicus]|uniref:DHA2 family efflux MFS transporter permease subunit n=1 Tax=Nocardioides nitrophenolicus TaxID=60489 RepID=UPI0027DDA869|nr:DHA2 family efflux MFS transporter permease subunit [Nocardioides nitrophenolicus]MBM7516725.1 EmrB/QacA subfamily drug resistance transporter [Nocardioides nitrophenolicus]